MVRSVTVRFDPSFDLIHKGARALSPLHSFKTIELVSVHTDLRDTPIIRSQQVRSFTSRVASCPDVKATPLLL